MSPPQPSRVERRAISPEGAEQVRDDAASRPEARRRRAGRAAQTTGYISGAISNGFACPAQTRHMVRAPPNAHEVSCGQRFRVRSGDRGTGWVGSDGL